MAYIIRVDILENSSVAMVTRLPKDGRFSYKGRFHCIVSTVERIINERFKSIEATFPVLAVGQVFLLIA